MRGPTVSDSRAVIYTGVEVGCVNDIHEMSLYSSCLVYCFI